LIASESLTLFIFFLSPFPFLLHYLSNARKRRREKKKEEDERGLGRLSEIMATCESAKLLLNR
jgi:hypothetical protein